jgi:ribonuclease HI
MNETLVRREKETTVQLDMFRAVPINLIDVELMFDGGCSPNPGRKYGSFSVSVGGVVVVKELKVDFGFGTNNEAEFNSLYAGLCATVKHIESIGSNPSLCKLTMLTDSTIVANRISGKYRKAKTEPEQRMANLTSQCREIILTFAAHAIKWHQRDNNVREFGH